MARLERAIGAIAQQRAADAAALADARRSLAGDRARLASIEAAASEAVAALDALIAARS